MGVLRKQPLHCGWCDVAHVVNHAAAGNLAHQVSLCRSRNSGCVASGSTHSAAVRGSDRIQTDFLEIWVAEPLAHERWNFGRTDRLARLKRNLGFGRDGNAAPVSDHVLE